MEFTVRFVPGDAPCLQFDVRDSGIGMNDDEIGRLFHPFSQADASTARRFGGSGLGLAISKRLAQLLGGDISLVDSRVGRGSCFRCTVATGSLNGVRLVTCDSESVELQSASQETPPQEETPLLQNCRILFAEDGPDNQRLISHVLKKAGAEVTLVENGQLAVDAALASLEDGRPFDITLMDMQMPVLGGYDATAILRERGYAMPIIALTAHAMSGDREKCLAAGCDDYATKPIDRHELIKTIRQFLHPQPSSTPHESCGDRAPDPTTLSNI